MVFEEEEYYLSDAETIYYDDFNDFNEFNDLSFFTEINDSTIYSY